MYQTGLAISPWPWKTASAGFDLALVEARDAAFIAASPLWLAQLVMALVEERTKLLFAQAHDENRSYIWGVDGKYWREHALSDFNLTPDLRERLTARMEEPKR